MVIVLFSLTGGAFPQGNNLTVQSMVNEHIDTVLNNHLKGDGVELSNGRFNNQPGIIHSPQIASFNRNGYNSFPFPKGLVITTGNSELAAGPFTSNTNSTGVITYNDQYIQSANLATDDINNCAAIDFDFLAYADTFAFGYVFASNEYLSFVCSDYNDVFAFFLTGTDPVTGVSSTRNIAVIPNTVTSAQPNGIPVSINTVNGGTTSASPGVVCYNGTYSQYYVSNQSGNGIGYNGRTTALFAQGKISACETYHMHIGICNIGDNLYDSGVFLEERSFESRLVTKMLMKNEWCIHEDIRFSYASGVSDMSYLVTPHGDTLWNEPFILHDVSEADSGYYHVHVHSALPCVDLWSSDSIKIKVVNPYKPDLGPDLSLCAGEIAVVGVDSSDENTTYHWNTGDNTGTIEVISAGQYVLDISVKNPLTNTTCRSSDTVNVSFFESPLVDFEADKTSGCTPLTARFTNNSSAIEGGYTNEWFFFDQNFNMVHYSTEKEPVVVFDNSGFITVKLVVSSEDGCKDSLTRWNYISASPQPQLGFSASPEISMMSENQGVVEFTSYISGNVLDNPNNTIVWNFGDGQTDNTLNPSHPYTSWGDYTVTLSLITEEGCSDSVSHVVVIEDDLVFPNVITPNGDGVNDVWAIGNLNTAINPEDPDQFRHNELRISDRFGKVVFHAKNYDTFSKDGQIVLGERVFDGLGLPDGVYYYTFSYKGKAKTTKFHGSITIIR